MENMEIWKIFDKKTHRLFQSLFKIKKNSNFSKLRNFFIFENLRNFINQVEKDKAVNSTDAGPKSG